MSTYNKTLTSSSAAGRRPFRLRLMGAHDGSSHFSDGRFVKSYDVTYITHSGNYDGGLLQVTDNPDEAMAFKEATDAMELWRSVAPKPFDVRQDGKPNRPLTAFNCEVFRI